MTDWKALSDERGILLLEQSLRIEALEAALRDAAATPSTVRYSFDDTSFGLTNNGNKIDCKLVARPQGLANEAWYRFASDLIHILTIDPEAAAARIEALEAALRKIALFADSADDMDDDPLDLAIGIARAALAPEQDK